MRLAEAKDKRAAKDALCKLRDYADAYDWAVDVDFDKAVATVWGEIDTGGGWVIDGYLVLIHSFKPWYSNARMIQEWLTLKLYDGGDINNVPPALLELAEVNFGASVVVTADSSPVNIMAKAYSNAGFSPLTQSFYKRVP